MNKLLPILFILLFMLTGCNGDSDYNSAEQKEAIIENDSNKSREEAKFRSIYPLALKEMMREKDFILIDVHIPKKEPIAGTDLFIPYDQIEANLEKLPSDKTVKIVLYCLGGSMSTEAATVLAAKGYSNVYDLIGGKQAYDNLSF